MENIVGQIASQGNFYMRKREIREIMRNLKANANIQIAAPRRVGKSSILYHLKDFPEKGFINLYIQVESSRNKDEFYRKIYREILKSDAVSTGKKFAEQFKNNKGGFLARLKAVTIVGTGFDFNESPEINYEEELTNLLLGLDLHGDQLVLMIDEFPEVILNIVEDNKGEVAEAKSFLQSNRELRNNPSLHGKVQFIYTGSNSLNVTVSNLDASSLINDLASITVDPWNVDEAEELITKVLDTYGYRIAPEQLTYIVSKMEWNIPFYFQLVIKEIMYQIEPEDEITNSVIDTCFAKMVEQKNDHHFDHYVIRLKRIFNDSQRKFVELLLNKLAQSYSLSHGEVFNLAYGILSDIEVRKTLDTLRYDGYIINTAGTENKTYKFNSPILKQWWYNHEC